MKIDKDQIVATALALLNESGLDALTTRALATRLGVKQPALYWHFKDRRALLDAMNEAIEAALRDRLPAANQLWQDYAFAEGCAFRAALMAHRDGARLHAGSRPSRPQLEHSMTVLTQAGMPVPLAIQLLVSIGRFVVGWVLEEQAEHAQQVGHPEPFELPDGLAGQAVQAFFDIGDDAAFETGLRMIIAGAALAVRPLPADTAQANLSTWLTVKGK